jgi:hypothetical protein
MFSLPRYIAHFGTILFQPEWLSLFELVSPGPIMMGTYSARDKPLSSFFFTDSKKRIHSIQLVKSDPEGIYLCRVPVLLPDDFHTRFVKIVISQLNKQSYNSLDRQAVSSLDKDQAFRLGVRIMALTFFPVIDQVDHRPALCRF